MSSLNIPPSAKLLDRSVIAWIETTFRRIEDNSALVPKFAYGDLDVTGNVEIDTGLVYVDMCVATMLDDPVAGASFVKAVPVNLAEIRKADYGNILISVFTSTYTVSSIAQHIGWIAMGTTRIR